MGPLKLDMNRPGDSDDGCAVADGSSSGDCAMRRGDAMDLLAAVDLIECNGAEDRRQNHSGRMDVDEVLVPLDAAACVLVGDLGSADGVGGGKRIHGNCRSAQCNVEVAVGGVAEVAMFRRCAGSGNTGDGNRNDRDESEPLVDLQHVGAAVKESLASRIAFGVGGRQAKVAERGALAGWWILRRGLKRRPDGEWLAAV